MRKLAMAAAVLTMLTATARADVLVVYGAGSLREAIGQIAAEFGQAHGLAVTTQFGPSGRMRERIEQGERVDLFTSADVGHARKLVKDGRASVMAVFARNTVCLLSPAKFGATTETALDKLLSPGVRVGRVPAQGRSAGRLHSAFVRTGRSSPAGQRRRAAIARRGAGHAAGRARRRDPATPTRTRSATGGWMQASCIAPGGTATPGCCPTRRSCSSRPTSRPGRSTGWRS